MSVEHHMAFHNRAVSCLKVTFEDKKRENFERGNLELSLIPQLCDLEQMTLTFTFLLGKRGTVIPASQGGCRDKQGRAC